MGQTVQSGAKIPVMDVPFETAADQINCRWPTTSDQKKYRIPLMSPCLFSTWSWQQKRLVLHVHNHTDSSASAVQIDDSKMDFVTKGSKANGVKPTFR